MHSTVRTEDVCIEVRHAIKIMFVEIIVMNWHHIVLFVVCIVSFSLLMMCFINSSFVWKCSQFIFRYLWNWCFYCYTTFSCFTWLKHYGFFSPSFAFYIRKEMVSNMPEFCKINYPKNKHHQTIWWHSKISLSCYVRKE